jgi:hypothetical protein
MTHSRKALETLIACLRGEPPGKADWGAVFEIANRTLLTPALFDALTRSSQLGGIPDEARAYLEFIHGRNFERNTRLRDQLIEAVGQLNSVGIKPTLLKGAVRLFCDPDERLGSRMTKDLDLSVEEHEGEAASACLFGIGYRDVVETRGMGRSQDVGILELRQRPRAASAAYLPREREKPSVILERAGVRARIPSAESRALHWIVHDLIKEGDYWRGCIDIRHLYDLFELTRTERDLDWSYLWSIMPDQLGRNVIETQLLTLHSFFGADLPPGMRSRVVVYLQYWRRTFAATHPIAGAPLRLAGDLAWGMRRMGAIDSLVKRGAADFARRVYWTLAGSRECTKL